MNILIMQIQFYVFMVVISLFFKYYLFFQSGDWFNDEMFLHSFLLIATFFKFI